MASVEVWYGGSMVIVWGEYCDSMLKRVTHCIQLTVSYDVASIHINLNHNII